MTRTEKYKELRERIKREIAENELENDFKLCDSEILKQLSMKTEKVLKEKI